MKTRFSITFLVLLTLQSVMAGDDFQTPGSKHSNSKMQLGRKLFFDANLSSPPGQSCGSCHASETFFTDSDKAIPTSKGVFQERRGNRNAPTVMYAAFSPAFHFDRTEGLYVGGQFLDGRAATLSDQAKGPFLNPLEMANPDKATVVDKVRKSEYRPLFERVYGKGSLDDTNKAFKRIADAIAAFERSPVFAQFTSKYDFYLVGKARLSRQEKRGRKVFEDPEKGNCAACHPDRPGADGAPPLFTDFTYDNLGVPKNPENPFYTLQPEFNPKGLDFVDKGLGSIVHDRLQNGKFKVPTLRNIAKTAPYMHNGYFKTLRGVVDFYSSRDIKPSCTSPFTGEALAIRSACWPVPEVGENVNHAELGMLGLTDQEVDDLVAFLRTLTDGYRPSY